MEINIEHLGIIMCHIIQYLMTIDILLCPEIMSNVINL